MKSIRFLLILSLAGIMFACNPAPKNVIPAANQSGALCNLSYGTHVRQVLDISLPVNRSNQTGTIVLIHGGAWIGGSKEDFKSLRELLSIQTGMAVAAINYRYVSPDSVGYPELMEDIDMALDFIDSKANDWTIASGKFGLAGHSAGGHMSLLYSYAYDSTQRVQAVSSLSGPTDLTDSLFQAYASNFNLLYVFEQLVDEDYSQNPQALINASPLFHLRNVPTQLQHGQTDNLVPLQQALVLKDSLDAMGYEYELIEYPNISHNIFGLLLQNTGNVTSKLADWFKTYLN